MLKFKSVDSSFEQCRYDVFLSFRGEDTRKTFTDHLYRALLDEGLKTFRDDEEVERGERIQFELENGIKQSKSWVVVFSKNYAFSSWCLDELVVILECWKNSDGLLLPVFYDVDPSDIRKQSGCISEAFSKHEEVFEREVDDSKRKDLMDRMKRWRTALTQVANLAGMALQNLTNGYESIFILEIVNVVKIKVTSNVLSLTPQLVGIDDTVQEINLWLRNESTNVEVLSLYGVGGVGKTTIARYVYNMNLLMFEGGSFLENISEYFEQSDGLVCLRRQLLSDISKGKTPTPNNIKDGILMIQGALCHRKLLIILDGVDQVQQIDAIFGMREVFLNQGSKIIITTQNVQLLNAHEHCQRYAVNTLNNIDSLKLFTQHAFRGNCPPEYINLLQRIMNQCQGLPLALKVLGASLHGKKVDVWRSAIEKLEIFPHCEIQKILQISYESLQDDHDKNLFLEIACFFNGEAKSFVISMLDECNYFTIIGIENLIDRCLLKVDSYKRLRMDNLIQSMGREIVRQQSPRDPGKRSRLWHHKDSLQILRDGTGTGTIEGLALDMSTTNAYQTDFKTEAFSMMHKLRLLKLNNVRLNGGYKDFPKNLKWLCWKGCPLRSLPNDFPLSSLVAIDMQSSKLKIFVQGNMLLGSLKFLNLSHSHDMVRTPSFEQLPALEQLILEDCVSLIEIGESIQMANGLVLLNLKDCKLLKKLPKNFGMLKLLETLIISGCSNLSMVPPELRKMGSLKKFHADGLEFGNSSFATQENKSWRDFITGLVFKAKLGPRLSLASLPKNSITSLSLVNCNLHDNAFPKDLFVAPSLKHLNLSENPIHFLPICFKGLIMVDVFCVEKCNQLQELETLPNIRVLKASRCPLLEKVKFKPDMSLTSFSSIKGCEKLLEVEKHFKIIPLGTMDSEMIKDCGIDDVESKKRMQMRYYNIWTRAKTRCPVQVLNENLSHGKAFSIFYPGSSVPIQFTSLRNVSSISFTVSSHSKLRYLNSCFVYNFVPCFKSTLSMRITNKTRGTMIIYDPISQGIPERDEYMTWLSLWKFGNHEVGPGDEVNISIVWFNFHLYHHLYSLEAKEFGVYLVYEEQEQAGIVNLTSSEGQTMYDILDTYTPIATYRLC